MVLSIPLPKTTEPKDLLTFGTSLVIYLLSFLVVGAYWNQHHHAFSIIDKINHKIIAANIFFLFFLSLIPLFTAWVITNQGSLLPVIGYDIIYLLSSFRFIMMFRLIMEESDIDEIKVFLNQTKQTREEHGKTVWRNFLFLIILVGGVIALSIYLPKLSIIIMMGIPVLSSIFNLFVNQERKLPQ